MHAGRFTRESRITTNIAHLSASRLKPIEFPIPPLEEQRRLIAEADARLDAVSTLGGEVDKTALRAASLRRSLLAAAFSGRLTGSAAQTDLKEMMPA
jgi:type I restriction enzyme S subunit